MYSNNLNESNHQVEFGKVIYNKKLNLYEKKLYIMCGI
jgi:hypothetical protein